MSTIDFTKVDAAFQHLAHDPKGKSQLEDFDTAINKLTGGLSGLNEFEAHYVASSLLQQRIGVQSSVQKSAPGSTAVHGFVIKTAVKAD